MPAHTINFAQRYPHFSKHARLRRIAGRIVLVASTVTLWSALAIHVASQSGLFIALIK